MATAPRYSRISLEQGTKEWHAWRNAGIGASDAPVIMGENPFKNHHELIEERRIPGARAMNAAMARGIRLEPAARNAYCNKFGRSVEPACLQSNEFEWLRASVDGLSQCGEYLVEIKCGESVYQKTAKCRKPPGYYYGQLQHALAVTGLEAMDFWCYLPKRPSVHVVVTRNDDYIRRLIEAERQFWETYIKVDSVNSVDSLS